MSVTIRVLGPHDGDLLLRVAPGVFDHPPDPDLTQELLTDPRHHLVVALDADAIVGMASGVHYIHPEKQPELWINEVGVSDSHQRRGIASKLLSTLLDLGRQLGCREAWVLTDRENTPAMQLYARCGGDAVPDQVMFNFDLSGRELPG